MSHKRPQDRGRKLTTLLHYKNVKALYDMHKTEDIADAVILRKYIYPVYPMSRVTLYKILCTPVNKELKELQEEMQTKLDI